MKLEKNHKKNSLKKSNTLSEKVVNPQLITMLDFDCSFFQQTVPQYNQEQMSIDNMHESVGIFVYKMACDMVSHSQNRAMRLGEPIQDQEKHA